jgi:hypothetical protein
VMLRSSQRRRKGGDIMLTGIETPDCKQGKT